MKMKKIVIREGDNLYEVECFYDVTGVTDIKNPVRIAWTGKNNDRLLKSDEFRRSIAD